MGTHKKGRAPIKEIKAREKVQIFGHKSSKNILNEKKN
jgi:hypothetical protein